MNSTTMPSSFEAFFSGVTRGPRNLEMSLKRLLRHVRVCTTCETALPLGARPILQLASSARLLIIGQAPGRKAHAPLWHSRLLGHLTGVETTLLVGHYAQRFYLGSAGQGSMTDTVRSFRDYGPRFLPLPHPSWRSVIWMRKHPWFEATVIPELRKIVCMATRH
jgi:uracil-DNA glycosylase